MMKMKLFLPVALIAITGFGIILMADDTVSDSQPPAVPDSTSAITDSTVTSADTTVSSEQSARSDKIVAYYFHGTRRCATCKKLEAYSREAIETGFKEELENGILNFRAVNFDEEENRHYIKDYELYTKSLVICDFDGDNQVRWKNLQKIWELVHNKEAFLEYVRNEVASYLEEN